MLLAVVVVIMILKVISVVILLKVFIAFCNIRGGGRGSGGVILYEKKIATEKKKYSTSPAAIGAFRRHFVESIAMFRQRIGQKHDRHREYYKN